MATINYTLASFRCGSPELPRYWMTGGTGSGTWSCENATFSDNPTNNGVQTLLTPTYNRTALKEVALLNNGIYSYVALQTYGTMPSYQNWDFRLRDNSGKVTAVLADGSKRSRSRLKAPYLGISTITMPFNNRKISEFNTFRDFYEYHSGLELPFYADEKGNQTFSLFQFDSDLEYAFTGAKASWQVSLRGYLG